MINESLINECYQNPYGFDLLNYHIRFSKPSEFHSYKGHPYSIYDYDFKKDYINFSDGISSHFELINHHNRNFLMGDKTCYPCSIVYKQIDNIKFLEVFIIPNGRRISISKSIFENPILCTGAVKEVGENIKDLYTFKNYLDELEFAFSTNDWWSSKILINTIKDNKYFSSFDIVQILKEKHLLNPIELCLASKLFHIEFTLTEIFNSVFIKKDVPKGILYLTPPTFDIEIVSSTSKIIEIDELRIILESFSRNNLEYFWGLEFLLSNLKLVDLPKSAIEDLFGIRLSQRIQKDWRAVPASIESTGLNLALVKKYYKLLKNNIRQIENKARNARGFNTIGTLFNENLLFTKLSEMYNQFEIISQYSPDWLKKQRFDIYIKDLNIAIEYNGLQHYQAVDYFGGEKGFEETKKRDSLKRRRCVLNNCKLIEVKYNQSIEDAITMIDHVIKEMSS